MFNQRTTYYLTLSAPRRGERVVASVTTDDRIFAEKLFGCGLRNEKDFCFNGLYTEEEVLHMFKPGTDIVGTFNPNICSCEKHKDYHNVPVFEVDDKKAYRIKGNKRLLVDLAVSNSAFEHVKDVLSGKIPALSSTILPVDSNQAKQSEPSQTNSTTFTDVNDDSAFDPGEFATSDDPLDIFDEDSGEPVFDDEEEEESDFKQDVYSPANVKNLASIYSEINTTRKLASDAKDDDFVSSFDAMFYGGQKAVVQSDAFAQDEKLQTRFGMNQSNADVGERIRSFLGIKNSQ